MPDLDAIMIGAGHNGLTCAAYLGMAGLRVRVLERRGVVGGACVHRGIPPRLPQLDRGLYGEPAAAQGHPRSGAAPPRARASSSAARRISCRCRTAAISSTGEGRTEREIAKFSAKDAARYGAYQAEIGRVADALRSLVLEAPPNSCRETSPACFASSASSPRSARSLAEQKRRRGVSADPQIGRRACSTTGSSPIRSKPCSASTRSSATWRAPTRAAPPMCCCITASAR